MPLYEYECTQCGQVEEALQKFSDKPLKRCRHCSGSLRKLISNTSFQLKGTGWYVTDYAKKTSTDPSLKTKSDKQNKTTDAKSTSDSSASGKSAD